MKTPFLFLICLGMMCCVSCKQKIVGTELITIQTETQSLAYTRDQGVYIVNATEKLSTNMTVQCGQTYLVAVFVANRRPPSDGEDEPGYTEIEWDVNCPDGQYLCGRITVTQQWHNVWVEAIRNGTLKQAESRGHLMECCIVDVPGPVQEKQVDFLRTARDYLAPNDTLNNVFFFDVDGDGVDEAFYATMSETSRDGRVWRVFYYEGGKWQKHEIDDIIVYADCEDFYYRDDVRRQPRLFVRDHEGEGEGPAAITRPKGSKDLVCTPFDMQEFENLWKRGVLKPLGPHVYSDEGKILYTFKGSVRPFTPYGWIIKRAKDSGDARALALIELRDFFRTHRYIMYSDDPFQAFFFDVDGDGVEEVIANTNVGPGLCDWRVFSSQEGTWDFSWSISHFDFQSDETGLYYRDDVKEQPRLFAIKSLDDSPSAIVLTKDKEVVVESFDRKEFDRLKEKGILKPVKSHWYDGHNQIMPD